MSERVMFDGGAKDGIEGVIGGGIQPVILIANGGVDGLTEDGEINYTYDRYERTEEIRRGYRVYRYAPVKGSSDA